MTGTECSREQARRAQRVNQRAIHPAVFPGRCPEEGRVVGQGGATPDRSGTADRPGALARRGAQLGRGGLDENGRSPHGRCVDGWDSGTRWLGLRSTRPPSPGPDHQTSCRRVRTDCCRLGRSGDEGRRHSHYGTARHGRQVVTSHVACRCTPSAASTVSVRIPRSRFRFSRVWRAPRGSTPHPPLDLGSTPSGSSGSRTSMTSTADVGTKASYHHSARAPNGLRGLVLGSRTLSWSAIGFVLGRCCWLRRDVVAVLVERSK